MPCNSGIYPLLVNVVSSDCIQYQRTTATRCPPAPLSVGHAGTHVVSLQGVPLVTGVGHCGSKGCTRDNSLTIFRSFGGRTTADSYREDTVPTFLVTVYMQCKHMQFKTSKIQASLHMHNHVSTPTQTKPHIRRCMYMHAPYTQIQAWCM